MSFASGMHLRGGFDICKISEESVDWESKTVTKGFIKFELKMNFWGIGYIVMGPRLSSGPLWFANSKFNFKKQREYISQFERFYNHTIHSTTWTYQVTAT